MNKIVLSTVMFCALAGAVFADGNAFTPLNFNDTSYGQSSSSSVPNYANMNEEAIGNENIQTAISQLENAQVDIRNDLINCKTKFADVDAQYKLVKAERDALKKQIRSIERRINDIDKAKERIRRNML
jgi:peptidoglycan hydrolase CwlO-like protein